MIIDDQKEQCLDMLLKGFTITETAKFLDISRQSIYNWLGDEVFNTELDKRVQELSIAGNKKILSDINAYINKIKELSIKGKSEKVQLEATTYLLDRIYGRPSTKVEVNEDKKDKENIEDNVLKGIIDVDAIEESTKDIE